VAVLGPSGSGKTTLMACLAGLRLPTSGTVRLAGHELTSMTSGQRARLRLSTIGFVFQHADLLPELTPVENVMLPGLLNGGDPASVRADAERLMADLGLRTSAQTAQLSGGEAQRLALARALITRPPILLADEPTGALDRATRDEVLEVLFGMVRSERMAAVVVTHDDDVAARADSTIRLEAVPV
jgi:ABC-type lipoprotein export system ATPase subunit